MTLLWHDSLDYRSSTLLAARYATATNLTLTGAHPQSGRKSLSVAGTSGTLQFVVFPATDTCFLGLMTWSSVPTTQFTFLAIKSPEGTTQVRVDAVAIDNKIAFLFYRGAGESLLHQTNPIDLSSAHYLEFVVKVSPSGSVALRVDGVEDSRADFVNTEAVSSVGWGTVTITPSSTGVGAFMRIADLYVDDSKAMGPVIGSLVRAGKVSGDWSPTHLLNGKYNLVILGGQSNMNGRGSPSETTWRTPNNKVLIWDNTHSPAFAPISAGTNTFGFFLPTPRPALVGPEMMFAELLAQMFEAVGETAVPNVRMVKVCQDASMLSVFPGNPQYSWNPSQAGSLFHLSMAAINDAVASLGGWSAIDSVDFFFFQGETEALTVDGPPIYAALNKDLFDSFQAAIPVTVDFTRVRIHEDLAPVYVAKDGIRTAQGVLTIPGRIIDIDEAVVRDGTHLATSGYDMLGDKFFQIWKANRMKASYLQDYIDQTVVDSLYFSGGNGKSMTVAAREQSQINLNQGPVLAATHRLHAEGVGSNNLEVVSDGVLQFPVVSVSSSSQWTAYKSMVEGTCNPDRLAVTPMRFQAT